MPNKEPEQDEVVLCTVEKILGTTVFVRIDKYGKEGVIATSEIAPGRIRNIRDYVVPGKKVVCKIIRIDERSKHMDLSLRRVTLKERKEVTERFKKEKDFATILKIVAGEKAGDVKEKILTEYGDLYLFSQSFDGKSFESLGLSQAEADKLLGILTEKKEREIFLKARISLSNQSSDGVTVLRDIFKTITDEIKELRISYISAPNYSLSVSSADYKDANKKLDLAFARLNELAKSSGCSFSVLKQ